MRIFNKANLSNNWKCLICGNNDDKPVTLVGTVGTQQGNVVQCKQIHVDCIDPLYDVELGVLYQRVNKGEQ